MSLSEDILDILQKHNGSISRNTLLLETGTEQEQLNQTLEIMEFDGKLFIKSRKTVMTLEAAGLKKAIIVRYAKNFSFAKPEDGTDDVYVAAMDRKNSLPGDLVLLSDVHSTMKGPEGSVEKVLQKGARLITGMVDQFREKTVIVPDSGFSYDIQIAKDASLKVRKGDKVKAILSYNAAEQKPVAHIIKIYGRAESARVNADAIIDAANIPTVFPSEVKKEAEKRSQEPITEEMIAARLDLRNEIIFTIDGADAKDLDDAISCTETEDGWILGVHIADVSHYVTAGSALDKEALNRGTSVYFADRVIPMLPEELSNGSCSLNAGTDKLAFTAMMQMDKQGKLLNYHFAKSVIRSCVRGVYSEVNTIFDGTATPEILEKYAPALKSLKAAKHLADTLSANSKRRGEIELESTELRFVLDDNGVCVDVSVRKQGAAEQMIEQLMIAANNAAALYAKTARAPFVYRVHEAPEAERLASLAELATACGYNAKNIKPGVKQTDLAEMLTYFKDTPYERLMSTQTLRTMAKAHYDTQPLGHFGLSLEDYCHFTSPIRRYPDTSIHRILSDMVAGVPTDTLQRRYNDFVRQSANRSSENEVRAMRAEREAEKSYAAEYMTQHIGEIHNGTVSGVVSRGIFVTLANGIEGFVNLTLIENAYFEFNGSTMTKDYVSGVSYSIGDEVTVKVENASVALGEIDFSLADKNEV